MSFLEDLEVVFGTADLYVILGLQKNCKEDEIKKAYRKKALQVHPDRAPEAEKETATKKFQLLGKLHSVLNDKDKRAVYDEEGVVDDEDDVFTQNRDWGEYWRLLFKRVSLEDIRQFETKYKGSEEEEADLRDAYIESEGDMDHILETVMCAEIDDEPRFHDKVKQWIGEGTVPPFKFVSVETKKKRRERRRRWEAEAVEAEEHRKELGLETEEGDDSLKALIKARQETREKEMDKLFDSLAEKYAPKAKKSKPSKAGKKGKSTA